MTPVRKGLFRWKRTFAYDKATQEPVIHKSICTGEATVGFVDKATGKYSDLRKVTDEADIMRFCREYGIDRDTLKTIY